MVWYQRLSVVGRFLALAFSVVVLAWAGWMGVRFAVDVFLLENNAFALRRFRLETNGRLQAEQVLHWAGLESGDNVLEVDLALIKRNLELIPMIHDVAVERVLPDRITVRVKERRPVFKTYYLAPNDTNSRIVMKPYMIDEHGYVLSPEGPDEASLDHEDYWQRLPELSGLTGMRLLPGERVGSQQIDFAIKAYQVYLGSSLVDRVKIRSIDVSQDDVLVARTSDQQEAILGKGDLMTQYRRWELMLDQASREGMRLISLDLSMKNNHPFKWEPRGRDLPQRGTEPQFVRRTEI